MVVHWDVPRAAMTVATMAATTVATTVAMKVVKWVDL